MSGVFVFNFNCNLYIQPVANAANGVQEFWLLGVYFNRLAQPGDVYVQGAGVAGVLCFPNMFEKFFSFTCSFAVELG